MNTEVLISLVHSIILHVFFYLLQIVTAPVICKMSDCKPHWTHRMQMPLEIAIFGYDISLLNDMALLLTEPISQ